MAVGDSLSKSILTSRFCLEPDTWLAEEGLDDEEDEDEEEEEEELEDAVDLRVDMFSTLAKALGAACPLS